jgi:hypothetical protein
MLRDPLYQARQNAQAALERIGSPAVEPLLRYLVTGTPLCVGGQLSSWGRLAMSGP